MVMNFKKVKNDIKKRQETLINKGLYAIGAYCIVEGTDLGLSLCFASPQKSDFFTFLLKKLHIFSYTTIFKNCKKEVIKEWRLGKNWQVNTLAKLMS